MGRKKATTTNAAYQVQLFGNQEKLYDWRPVQDAHKGMVIVTQNESVTVLAVRQDDDCIYLTYTEPGAGKTEQLYNLTDYVYMKL